MTQYVAAQQLDWHLGDPFDPEQVFSFPRIVQHDEAEEFPLDEVALVRNWGLGDYLVPEMHGGKMNSFEQLFWLLRVISRRDLTVSIAYGATTLAAIPVWLNGSAEQKSALSRSLREGNFGAIGLTEEAHGSDLLSCEFAAVKSGSDYILSGEKWLINNGTQGKWITILARTNRTGSPLGFSFIHVHKSDLDRSRHEHLAKIKTLGIRGADMSGMRFDECRVPASSVVGDVGEGITTGLKTLQVSRTIFTCFSTGAGDTALRIALKFAVSRQLYGNSVFAIPVAHDQLVGAFLDLLIADCMSYSACRAIQACPEQMSVYSAVVKYLVPTMMEEAVYQSALVVGARYYVRQHFESGVFQKILRDNMLIGLFDGSTAVNLYVIASQLKEMAESRARGTGPDEAQQMAVRKLMFDWTEPLAPFDPSRFNLSNAGRDDTVNGLPSAARGWRQWTASLSLAPWVVDQVQQCLDSFVTELERSDEELRTMQFQGAQSYKSTPAFRLAKRHCWFHAASACVYTWLMNQHHGDEFFASGEWLAVCLERILQRLTGRPVEVNPAHVDAMSAEMIRRHNENILFSAQPIPLAQSPTQPGAAHARPTVGAAR